mgnify:FL=1
MKGLCKTECGCDVEYESHKFSDGFVYYLPRNLDGTVHNCIFSEEEPDFFDIEADGWDDFCEKHKERLKIDPVDLQGIVDSMLGGWFEPMDLDFMEFIKDGNMFGLKKYVEEELIRSPMPTFAHRSDYRWGERDDDIGLPTRQGYQLEYLGKIYELMIRLEDAKKCYELQYECTKEPELLEISKELDKKIQERKSVEEITKNVPNNLTSEDMWKKINSTQSNVKKYVVELFSNNFTEVFKRNLKIKNQTEKIRRKDEESLLKINEKHVMDNVGLGDLLHILKTSKTKRKSKFSGKCKICGTYYERHQDIFLEDNPKRIMCADEICFVKQGGVSKNIPWALINRIENINDLRNALAHPRDFDKEWLRIHFIESYVQCIMVNKEILDFFKNKEST